MNFSRSLQFSTEAVRRHGRRLDYHEQKYALSLPRRTPTNKTSSVGMGKGFVSIQDF